jgi:hypothetical protein
MSDRSAAHPERLPRVALQYRHVPLCRRTKNKKAAKNGRLHDSASWIAKELFFAVLFGVSLHGLFSVPSGVNHVAPRCMSMVCGLLVIPGLVMLGRFPVVASGMCQMF